MQRLTFNGSKIVATAILLLVLGQPGQAADPSTNEQPTPPGWQPEFYAFCVGMPKTKNPSIPEQARMLQDVGFDGVGYPLWLDDNLDKNLRTLDEAGLDICLLYTSINVNPEQSPYDPRLPDAIRRLKGRPVTVCVLLRGFPPADPRGAQPAVKILRQLGDVATESDLRISIYHHTRDWTESLIHSLRVVDQTDHPRVGANFNLCHWLMVDGDKDYAPVLRENADKIFVVTINGAQPGTKKWANGLIQPLDRGDFDNLQLLRTLREIGYRGPIGLMCYGIPEDPREHLERSMKVWKTWQTQ